MGGQRVKVCDIFLKTKTINGVDLNYLRHIVLNFSFFIFCVVGRVGVICDPKWSKTYMIVLLLQISQICGQTRFSILYFIQVNYY